MVTSLWEDGLYIDPIFLSLEWPQIDPKIVQNKLHLPHERRIFLWCRQQRFFWRWIEKPLESLDALEQDTGSEDEENLCRMQHSWTQR